MNSLTKLLPLVRRKVPAISQVARRNLRITPVSQLKEVRMEEKDGEITFKGVYVKSPREDYVIQPQHIDPQQPCTECPLCRLGPGIRLAHTDVLILNQFVSSDGRQLHKSITKLCYEQNRRVGYLIVMARHAGLLPKRLRDGTIDPRDSEGWKANNKYYDEEGIDDFFDSDRRKI